MENTKQTISEVLKRVPDTTRKVTDWLGKAILIIAGVLIIYSVAAQASSSTQPLAPQAQRSYDANRIAFCESEKTLAQSKMQDYLNGIIKLSPDDVKKLAEKKDVDCLGF